MDLSELDKKYFVDKHTYNCPFCKRNNVKYFLVGYLSFDWTNDKECFGYLVQCSSCDNVSIHFSFEDIRLRKYSGRVNDNDNSFYVEDGEEIDDKLFYSRPSSFFTLDDRIPDKIRNLIFEAEQSRQANLLIGASACLRKAIYELIKHEKAPIINEKTGHTDYQASIKKLKEKFNNVSPELFDALANIQEMASDPLHEESWESWDSKNLRFLIELLKATLEEIYVIPEERKNRLSTLTQLKAKFEGDKNLKAQGGEK
jgi:hypothetical protein